jgi:hypothetical protein
VATFPTFEATLIKIANALGAMKGFQTRDKKKFKNNDMNLVNMSETWKNILNNIFDALELDKAERDDLIVNISHDYQSHKTIEKSVYTFKASPQKVVWQYLARVLIPALARHSVFWQIESKIDAGMPGGKFWYLPFLNPNEQNTKIELPIQQVMNWLLDLIEEPKASIAKNLETDLRIYDSSGNTLKNLHNWQSGKVTPEISSLQATFPDDVTIDFKGCFKPFESQCLFEQALDFVAKKGQCAQTLQHEINFSEPDLVTILSRECTHEQKVEFVNKIDERYQQPTTKTVRQRLLVARAVQEGYEQLVKFITPETDKFCTDLGQNKVMQLVRLYEATYNHTMQAHEECLHIDDLAGNRLQREHYENRKFTQSLPPFLRFDLLLCVATEDFDTIEMVAPRLNDIFSLPEKERYLDDIFPSNQESMTKISESLAARFNNSQSFNKRTNDYLNRLIQGKAPFKLLKSISDFKIVYELAKCDYPNPKILPLLFVRLKELESSPDDQIRRVMLELDLLLSQKKFDGKTEKQVEELLSIAWDNPEHQYNEPPILKLNAYHYIAQNKLKEAEKLLKKAIDKCKENSFGSLRGKLARDAFALAISNQKLIPNNHETYFKDMMFFGGWKDESDVKENFSIFNISRELHEFFWKKLYRHYPNYTPLYSESTAQFEDFIRDFMPVIKAESSIDAVLKKHRHLKNNQLKSPQSDSIILLILKISYDILFKAKMYPGQLPLDINMADITTPVQELLSAVRKVISRWPEVIDLSDFKQQTPLMMAVHNQDYKTVEVLLQAGANRNLQDINGRTALHSASASRCIKSAKLLIQHDIDEKITCIEGATALHTAIRVGEIEIAKLLMETFPHLLEVKEFNYRTPLMLAEEIATNVDHYKVLTMRLQKEKRRVVSHDTYKKLFSTVSSYSKGHGL